MEVLKANACLVYKRRKQKDALIGEDGGMIEKLPEAILCHVLSFLPTTKDAVRTSVLSKRWRYVWTFVPLIEIDEGSLLSADFRTPEEVKCRFTEFVDRVLRLNKLHCLRKFSLNCKAGHDFPLLSRWISSGIMRDVREIDLQILGMYEVMLPPSVCTSKKLVILKLSSKNIRLDVPTSVSLPSLKILRLHFIDPFNTDSINNLLDGCPVLEDLDLLNVRYAEDGNPSTLVIQSSSLKSLRLHIQCSHNNQNLVVDATNLERLHILYHPSVQYDMVTLSPLVEVKFDRCCHCYAFHAHRYRLVELLRKWSTTKSLFLSPESIEFFETRLDTLPMFHNLTHLELTTYFYCWPVLFRFLECSPNLITFILHRVRRYPGRHLQFNAPGRLINLEELKITGFRGYPNEMKMVSYFLKNAAVLKKISIQSSDISSKKHAEITKKLLKLKVLTACQIAFD